MDIPDSYSVSEEISTAQVEIVTAPKALGLVQRFGYKFPEFSSINRRLQSYNSCSDSITEENKKNFAIAGFYFLEPIAENYKDCLKIRCFSCGLKLISNRGFHSLAYHVFLSNDCQYLQMIIPTHRFNQVTKKYKETKKFLPYSSNYLLVSDLFTEENYEQNRCVVCLTRQIQVLYLPCQHYKCCRICAVSIKNCPICRSRIMAVTFPIC